MPGIPGGRLNSFNDVSDAHRCPEVQRKIDNQTTKDARNGGRLSPPAYSSYVDLFGDTQCVFQFDTQVSDCAVHLGVA